MSLQSRLSALREEPETARAGLKWTEEENDQLMKDVMDGMDLDEVAKKHQRTVIGIKSRVMTNALTMMDSKGLTIQDVSKLVHISEDEIEYHRQKQEYKADATKVKKNVIVRALKNVTPIDVTFYHLYFLFSRRYALAYLCFR